MSRRPIGWKLQIVLGLALPVCQRTALARRFADAGQADWRQN